MEGVRRVGECGVILVWMEVWMDDFMQARVKERAWIFLPEGPATRRMMRRMTRLASAARGVRGPCGEGCVEGVYTVCECIVLLVWMEVCSRALGARRVRDPGVELVLVPLEWREGSPLAA